MSDDWKFMSFLPPTTGRYIVFDTETTGLNLNYDHILELAAIEIINGVMTGKVFHVFIKPRTKIRKEATEVHKMDNDFYKKNYEKAFDIEKQLLINFLSFVENSFIFAHNAVFDYNFLCKELEFHGLPKIPKENFRCTMRIYKKLTAQNKLISYTLESCAKSFNIETDTNRLHTGIYDTEICARMLIKIFERYNINEKTHQTVKSNNSLESCIKNIPDIQSIKSCNANYVQGLNNDKSLSLNTNTVPIDRDKAVRELRSGLLTTMDDTNNLGGNDINNDEFLSQRELSVCISEFDNLSLVYSDSKATTNTLNQKGQEIGLNNQNKIQVKYDEKLKALTDMNRSYVINTINNNNHGMDPNFKSVQKIHDNNRKEFENKIDRNTLKEHFEKFNK